MQDITNNYSILRLNRENVIVLGGETYKLKSYLRENLEKLEAVRGIIRILMGLVGISGSFYILSIIVLTSLPELPFLPMTTISRIMLYLVMVFLPVLGILLILRAKYSIGSLDGIVNVENELLTFKGLDKLRTILKRSFTKGILYSLIGVSMIAASFIFITSELPLGSFHTANSLYNSFLLLEILLSLAPIYLFIVVPFKGVDFMLLSSYSELSREKTSDKEYLEDIYLRRLGQIDWVDPLIKNVLAGILQWSIIELIKYLLLVIQL